MVNHFGNKYSTKDVENVLEKLSEKGCIMDLGIVYEWVREEEWDKFQKAKKKPEFHSLKHCFVHNLYKKIK